jgi:hypothetical protein
MLTKYSKMEMIGFILHTIIFDDSAKLIEYFCRLSYRLGTYNNIIYYVSNEFKKGCNICLYFC